MIAMSQKSRILNHLKTGKAITQIEALNLFGCFRLASRIEELRSQGYDIKTVMIDYKNKRFAKYLLGR